MNKTSIHPCRICIIIGFIVSGAFFFAYKKANPGNTNPPTSINTGGGVLVSDYLCNAFKLFKANTKFWIATYAMRQSYPPDADFTATADPWVLNSLFTGRSVELLPNGESQGR
jgi:hypothetical protein